MNRLLSLIFLAIVTIGLCAAAHGQASQPAPRLIRTQAEFDSLDAKIPAGVRIVLDSGKFELARQLRLDGVLAGQAASRAQIKYTGPIKPGETYIVRVGTDARLLDIDFDCAGTQASNGAGVADVRGDGAIVAGCTASGWVRDFVKVSGARDTLIVANKVESVYGYFVYASGLNDRPAGELRIIGNECDQSLMGHIVRFHATEDLEVAYNKFGRPNLTEQACIIKDHDGARHSFHDNELWGGRKRFSGVVSFGPLGGKDGGMNKPPGAARERQLRLKLSDVQFYNNRCDDVVVHVTPGLSGLLIEGNVFDYTRDVTFNYKPAENGCDYRAWRGEPTGAVRANAIMRAEANQKPVSTLPAGVKLGA